MRTNEKTRFDTRLPKEQKEYFEYAATLGGYRNLTEFIISSVQERANKIIDEHKNILASKRDKEIFFELILNPTKPNKKLQDAAVRYKEAINEK